MGDQEKVTEFKHWLGEVLDSKNDHLKRKAAFMVRAFKARGVLLYYALKKDVTMLDLPLAQKLNNFGFFVWLIIMDAEASSNAEFWKF